MVKNKMFGNILKKRKDKELENDNSQMIQKISKMNLTDMRSFVNNKIGDLEVNQKGLQEVMNRLTTFDQNNSKHYLSLDDRDSKKKKGFDLVLLIAKSIYVNADIVEQFQKFIVVYEELIKQYDKENKEIYMSRLKDAISLAIDNVNKQSELGRKAKVLGA